MSLTELLLALRERGVELRVDGERLRAIAEPGALTKELSDAIRTHKAELLELLKGATSAEPAAAQIPRAENRTHYPLSITQNRAAVSAREGAVLPTAFRLRGPLDKDALRRTLEQIIARHAPLRTVFQLDQDTPEQSVLASVALELDESDLSALAGEAQEAQQRKVLDEQRAFRFDVTRPPLFRFHLIKRSEIEHVLFAAFSPLVFDGWSFDVFWNELRLGYAALAAGSPWPLPPLPIEYADYVAFQRRGLEERKEMLEAFWRKRMGEQLPALPLPTDRPRPPVTSNRGGNLVFELPAPTVHAVRQFARDAQVTPQMVMLGTLYALLNRLGGAREMIVASPVEARGHASMEGLIGPFVNMLLLPMQVDGTLPFAKFVVAVRDECLSAYDHQDYPIEWLRVRSRPNPGGGISPAFQVEFSFQQVSQRGSHMGALALSQIELESGAATNDLTLWVKDWGERIAGAVEFKTDVFDRATVVHWFDCYTHLLLQLVQSPETPMDRLDLLGGAREAVEAAARTAGRNLPEWVARSVACPVPGGPVELRVVDEYGQLRPLGAIGKLELVVGGQPQATDLRVRLRHDGQLQPVVAEVSAEPRARGERERPRTDLEQQMVKLFAEMLGVAEVGATDNYFELGGNSLIAVRLFAEVHRLFGVRLPAATILEANTPRLLARLVSEQFASRQSCLVKLRAGTGKRSLFLIHDADGETLLYLHLARRMPEAFHVFGIEPLREGRVPMVHTTLQECAAHYVSEMRRQQPDGPYYVGGLCAGGLIAFEVARQLVAQGAPVGLAVFIEAAPPTAEKSAPVAMRRMEAVSRLLSGLRIENARGALGTLRQKLVNTLRYEQRAQFDRARAKALVLMLRHVYKGGRNWPEALEPATAREVFSHAEAEYKPSLVSGVDALLFKATKAAASERAISGNDDQPFRELLVDEDFGWSPWLDRPIAVIDTPGGHSTMLREPNVAFMAERLCEAIERAEQRHAAPRASDLDRRDARVA